MSEPTPEQIKELASAVWQVLDDMGERGYSCCGAAKAQLRIAFEPFIDDDTRDCVDYSLQDAEAVIAALD